MRKNKGPAVTGLVLLAKKSGLTSFSSLWAVKHALETEKVGHTGTLDSFADGLLVVLTGRLTHLVPHITAFTKTYLALVCFGKETDTLDPTGKVIKRGPYPSRKEIEDILPSFTGPLLQKPPAFSALHVGGKRASDLVRSGQDVKIEARQIFIYKNTLIDYMEGGDDSCAYAIIEVQCSKGTYIRSLARDIGQALNSPASLSALRRTQVGPYKLESAAFAKDLPPFTFDLIKQKKAKTIEREDEWKEIRDSFFLFTPLAADMCGLRWACIKKNYESYLENGRPLSKKMIEIQPSNKDSREIALFYQDELFAGMLASDISPSSFYKYSFIASREKSSFKVFSFDDLVKDRIPLEMKKRGTALSVGAFDGLHLGHRDIIKRLLDYKKYVKGLVTFSSPFKAEESTYTGNIFTLSEKLEVIKKLGLDFALVIDFSPEFSKIDGSVFISLLVEKLGMKVLAEGSDFRCGYRGALDMKGLALLAEEKNFDLCQVPDAFIDGEKVSSSSVRSAIKSGNMEKAKLMLSAPFSLDCAGLSWHFANERAEAKVKEGQVLPPDGSYSVLVNFSEDAEEDSVELKAVSCTTFSLKSMHTECCLRDGRIFVNLPTKACSDRIQAIQFI